MFNEFCPSNTSELLLMTQFIILGLTIACAFHTDQVTSERKYLTIIPITFLLVAVTSYVCLFLSKDCILQQGDKYSWEPTLVINSFLFLINCFGTSWLLESVLSKTKKK